MPGSPMVSTRHVGLALALAAVMPWAACAAAPAIEPFGTLKDGRAVQRITLRNAHGMTVRVLTLGGVIAEISVPDARGTFDDVVLQQPDIDTYLARGSFSALLGRYANRIGSGGYTLDGRRVDLPVAANGVILHGGADGFNSRIWSIAPAAGKDGNAVSLTYVSPDGESGFPGTLRTTVRYTLGDDDTLTLDYSATTDKPTVVNFSHHAYFNLGGSTFPLIADECIQILAKHYTPTVDSLPTGEIAAVRGTAFDLTAPTRIGERLASQMMKDQQLRGYDHNFVLDKPAGTMALAARVWDPSTGRVLEVRTTQPGVQFFTAAQGGPPPSPAPAAAPGAPPAPRPARAPNSLALETQHFPDSPNHPNFPSTVLRPGQRFHEVTSYHFATYRPDARTCAMPAG